MTLISIIQSAAFYLIVLGFIGYGAYKLYEFYKKNQKPKKYQSWTKTVFNTVIPGDPKNFKSIEEIKRNMKGGNY